MSDLVRRLRIKAGMIEMGEMIAWGSDSALMREAADALEMAATAVQEEPVAWQLRTPDGRVILNKEFPAWADGGDGYKITPLYAAPQPAEQQPPADGSLTPVPDELFAAEFNAWWEQHGQFCRAGGGGYERTFAFEAWRHLYPQLMNLQMAAAEQQPSPDMPPWEELDYSKMTRKKMAVYIGQQNFTVTALRKRIERMKVKVRNQREALRQMSSAPDVTQLVEALELFASNPIPTIEDFDKARAALAVHRKGGEA